MASTPTRRSSRLPKRPADRSSLAEAVEHHERHPRHSARNRRGPFSAPKGARPFRRRRWIVVGILVVIAAAAVGVGVADPFGTSASSGTGTADNAYPTSLATVTQRSLTSQTQVSATLGYAGSYSVVNQAQGTITALPTIGQVISQGQVLYQVNGSPVVLLYGSTPAYRTLAEGATAADVTGPDVQELNADLVALGYVSSAESEPDL